MSKPFKIDESSKAPEATPRGKQMAPPQVLDKGRADGVGVARVIRENRAEDHPTPAGKPRGTEEVPWPDVGATYNDKGKPPMKVG